MQWLQQMGFEIPSGFGYGIKGVLGANCNCAGDYIMDLGGFLDSTINISCVKALVCAFWFSLQQLRSRFLTQEKPGPKLRSFGDTIYFAYASP